MGRLCPGHKRHVRLQGGVEGPFGQAWRTSFAAAYPPPLCAAWARVARLAAPELASSAGEPRLLDWWGEQLGERAGRPRRRAEIPRPGSAGKKRPGICTEAPSTRSSPSWVQYVALTAEQQRRRRAGQRKRRFGEEDRGFLRRATVSALTSARYKASMEGFLLLCKGSRPAKHDLAAWENGSRISASTCTATATAPTRSATRCSAPAIRTTGRRAARMSCRWRTRRWPGS